MRLWLWVVIIGSIVLLIVGAVVALRGRAPGDTPSPSPSSQSSAFPSAGATTPPSQQPEETPSPSATPGRQVGFRPNLCAPTWNEQRDEDGDRLPDAIESVYQTDPRRADTDGDGFPDGIEVERGYDPRIAGSARLDSDRDGLLDHEECEWKTDAFAEDTDGDGFRDGDEVRNGYDPTIKGDGKGSDRLNRSSPLPSLQPTASPQSSPSTASPSSGSPLATQLGHYLRAVDETRPAILTNGAALAQALSDVVAGKPARLVEMQRNLRTWEERLKTLTVPAPAREFHAQQLELLRYLDTQFGALIASVGNQTRFTATVIDMQRKIPQYARTIDRLRQNLAALAGT